MGYYQTGSMYRGDYYRGFRGDPGIGSFLKGIAETAAGFIPGVGPIISKVIGSIGGGAEKAAGGQIVKVLPSSGISTIRAVGGKALGVIKAHPVLTAAGAAGVLGGAAMLGRGGRAAVATGGGFGRRRRRMRVTNPKALRRALRRAHGFARLAMKTIKLVHPQKKGRFGGFKKAKRKVC